ncbi:hypothetical protein ACJZ2D_005042 [Fusarium nematophilum]
MGNDIRTMDGEHEPRWPQHHQRVKGGRQDGGDGADCCCNGKHGGAWGSVGPDPPADPAGPGETETQRSRNRPASLRVRDKQASVWISLAVVTQLSAKRKLEEAGRSWSESHGACRNQQSRED